MLLQHKYKRVVKKGIEVMLSFFKDIFLKKVNGMSDTETIIDIGMWHMDVSDYIPILTQRTKNNIQQYYLLDVIKIWQKKI